MLWLLAAAWELNPSQSASPTSLWRAITDRLQDIAIKQLQPVILLDDVDQTAPASQGHIARLARYDSSPDARLSIVLSGRAAGMARLEESLLSQADLRIDVEPWQRQRLNGSSTTNSTAPAVKRQTLPRRRWIVCRKYPTAFPPGSQLAELSLLAGAGQNLHQIDAQVVESVLSGVGLTASSI